MTEEFQTSAIQPLGRPRRIDVQVDREGGPSAVAVHTGQWRRVALIDEVWRVAEEWWRETPHQRTYLRLILEGGRLVTVYHDGIDGHWYEQQYGDER